MSKFKDIVLLLKDVSQIATDLLKYQVDQVATAYKEVLTRVLKWLLVTLAAIVLASGGLGLILWGCYVKLSEMVGPVGSSLILGVPLLLIATIMLLIAKNLLKD